MTAMHSARASLRSRLRPHWFVYLAAVLAVSLFLAVSALGSGPGFPLDDGWIHQTYARNLAQTGRWEYAPGVVSSGSTAPLWTLLLAVGYLLRLPYLAWAYLLGTACLLWLAVAGMALWRTLWPEQAQRDWLAGLVLVLTWPLVWAAASGMETLVFTALALTLMAIYTRQEEAHGFWVGMLGGLLVLTRPEGVLLLFLLVFGWLLQGTVRTVMLFLLGALLPVLPYFAFNLNVSGQPWPNTFYAKQAEYAAVLARPLALRFLELLYFNLGGPLTGWRGISAAHLLLLPGLLLAGWHAVRQDLSQRRLLYTLPLLWAAGHLLAYAWRLPVTYQHGRYLLPALPVWLLFGLAGWQRLFAFLRARSPRRGRLLLRSGVLAFAVLLLLFLLLGAQAYRADVAFIQSEMVDVAYWLQQNTPDDALVAAHDIGAIGYFAQRPLLDLAGLVSPEIAPILGDEAAIADYVRQSGADYLVTAPGWPYPTLTRAADTRLLYHTAYAETVQEGLNNMAVYRLP